MATIKKSKVAKKVPKKRAAKYAQLVKFEGTFQDLIVVSTTGGRH